MIDKSALRPTLMKLVFVPVYQIIRLPRDIHPNVITLAGLAFSSIPLLIAPHIRDFSAVWVFSCFITLYVICDHLDGMHAKETNQTSEFGAALDHLSDYICGIVHAIVLWVLSSASALVLLLFVAVYHHSFAISHVEHQRSGVLYFGRIGPLEAVFSVSVFYILASLDGRLIVADDAPTLLSYAYFFLVIVGFLWSYFVCSRRIERLASECWKIGISTVAITFLFYVSGSTISLVAFCAISGISRMAYILFSRPYSRDSGAPR